MAIQSGTASGEEQWSGAPPPTPTFFSSCCSIATIHHTTSGLAACLELGVLPSASLLSKNSMNHKTKHLGMIS